jgi:TPR repeat protein
MELFEDLNFQYFDNRAWEDFHDIVESMPEQENSAPREKRPAERVQPQFFCEACLSKAAGGWQLVDPDTSEKKDWLRVEVDLSDEKVSAKSGNAQTLRAYAVTSNQHRIVVSVACEDVSYKLALAAPGKVPSDAFYFCLLRSRGDVFHLHLVKQGNTEPKPQKDKVGIQREANFVSLLRRAKKSKNWDEAEALLDKFYGDTAYIYGLWQSREKDIRVGDVVARVMPHSRKQQVCVTKKPDASKCTVLGWGVVANHETTPGFSAELPQPVVRNPHGRPANFVAMATQGIVAVMTKGTCVAGQWLLASGDEDGFAVADMGCNDADVSLRRLGKVQSVGEGCVFVEVNFENNVLRPDKAMEAPQNERSEEKSKICLKEGNELRKVDGNNLLKGIKVYKRGLRDDSSAYIRALLWCAISSCYLTLEKSEKAKKFAKRATRLCAIHSDGFFVLAQAYLALNVPPKAQMSINRATAMCPDREDYVELAKKIQLAMRDHFLGRSGRDDLDGEKASEINDSIMQLRNPDISVNDVRKSEYFDEFLSCFPLYRQKLLKMELLMKDRKYKEAIEFGESMISEKHAGVIFNLTNLYSSGVGGEKKPKEAIDLLWVVAGVKDDGPAEERLNGVAEAKGLLAEYLFHGHPFVQRDTSLAYKMAYEGAIRGAHNAQNMLGLCLQGRGDFHEALDWFRISAEGDGMTSGGQTDSAAIVNAAMLFLNGHGTLRNPHRALRYLERASQIGHHCHDDMVAKLRQVLKGKSAYMSYDAMMQKLPPDVKAMFASLQKMNEPALVMRASVKLDLVPQCANGSPYGKSLASAFYTWKVGINMLERNVDVGKALKLMAQALEVDNIMCPVVEGLQKTLVRKCNDVLAREPKNRDALFLLAYTKIQASYEWIALSDHAVKLFPNDSGLIYMYGTALCFQEERAKGEAVFARGVKLFPKDVEFRYGWAGALRFVEKDAEAKLQYFEYLKLAPFDHRMRPHAFYHLALLTYESDAVACELYLKQGREAEKLQLPPFVPFESPAKVSLQALCLIKPEEERDFKPGVRRSRIVRRVRKENRKLADELERRGPCGFTSHGRAQPISSGPINWNALEQIVLLDFVPMEDKVHEGCFMELTVINHPLRKTATHFLVQDQNMDVEPMAIYCAPDFKIRQGDRLQVARPYQRTSVDLRSNIRVDDLKTVRLVGFNQICSFCCKPAPKLSRCARCKVALYCCAAHQKRDWEELDHKIECKSK